METGRNSPTRDQETVFHPRNRNGFPFFHFVRESFVYDPFSSFFQSFKKLILFVLKIIAHFPSILTFQIVRLVKNTGFFFKFFGKFLSSVNKTRFLKFVQAILNRSFLKNQ